MILAADQGSGPPLCGESRRGEAPASLQPCIPGGAAVFLTLGEEQVGPAQLESLGSGTEVVSFLDCAGWGNLPYPP